MPTISRSNNPQVLGLVSMIAATSGASALRTASTVTIPSSPGRYGSHGIADQRGGGWVGAMGGIGNQHHAPRLSFSARFDRRLDRHHAAELAMRAGLWRHRDGVHARHGQQGVGERLDKFERPLRGRNRLQRVDVGESRQARHFLVEARIVLHRAGAQRIESLRRSSNCCATSARSDGSPRVR